MEKFTNKELEIISNGLISLIGSAAKAKGFVTDTASQNTIDDYMKTLQTLNSKVCRMDEVKVKSLSNYKLYGTELICDDSSLKAFSKSVYENCPLEAIMEDSEERRDLILESVGNALEDDISRTDIDYEELLVKYKDELGDLFFRMWDRGLKIPTVEFLGEGAKKFFNDIVYFFVAVHYDELTNGK